MGETPRNSVLLVNAVKNYRSSSPLACEQSLLVLSSNGKATARVARAGWPEAGCPGAPHVARGPRKQVLCAEDLHSWWGGGEEVTY